MFLASNWYFFMAGSTGKETKPRNPRKRKVNRDKTLAIFPVKKSLWM